MNDSTVLLSGVGQRKQRLQVLVTEEEAAAIEKFRFLVGMPSQSAAMRELFRRGLASTELD